MNCFDFKLNQPIKSEEKVRIWSQKSSDHVFKVLALYQIFPFGVSDAKQDWDKLFYNKLLCFFFWNEFRVLYLSCSLNDCFRWCFELFFNSFWDEFIGKLQPFINSVKVSNQWIKVIQGPIKHFRIMTLSRDKWFVL